MTGPGAPSRPARRTVSAAARRLVHLLLGHALVDKARRALRLVLRVAIRPTTSSLIRCAGSRRPSRPGRCCEDSAPRRVTDTKAFRNHLPF